MAVEAHEYRTCDVCGGERTDITHMPKGHYQDGWSLFDYEGGRAEVGPKCTAKVLKKSPELAKAAAKAKTQARYGADGDCG